MFAYPSPHLIVLARDLSESAEAYRMLALLERDSQIAPTVSFALETHDAAMMVLDLVLALTS
jgi:hypothetical protein